MLTRLTVKNFKRISYADIELGSAVVFVGPNNSGKTTALQALALWGTGLKAWVAERGMSRARERIGVTINRRELIALPVPDAKLLWRDLHVREAERDANGKQRNTNVLITITVHGQNGDKTWQQGLEFDYANPESFYCRPVEELDDARLELLRWLAENINVAFLPPMSGLAAVEPKAESGRIDVLLGEGRTAEVLRNLCYMVYQAGTREKNWDSIVTEMRRLFGIELLTPEYNAIRGEIDLSYKTSDKVGLDISTAGRGLQQTLLLLAFLHAKPRTVVMLDEPDAHLEVLRQREIYNLVKRVAEDTGGQVIAASHSEVVLNEAAGKDTVIAFLGKPHRINDQGSQLKKSLLSIGFEHYLQAEQAGWVLFLEGSTDLAILQILASRLAHPAATVLERPYVDYVNSNTPPTARERFYGVREARHDLRGLAIFDRLDRAMTLQADPEALMEVTWSRREIENYIVSKESLLAWAGHNPLPEDLIERSESQRRQQIMSECISSLEQSLIQLRKPSPWGGDLKVSDDFLDPLFENFFDKLGEPKEQMRKKNYYELARFIPLSQIPVEVTDKLQLIVQISELARPAQ